MFLGGASSCTTGVKWDPNFYKASAVQESITDRNSIEVKCYEPRFDEFACLHKDKIKELAEILANARMPKEEKELILKVLNDTLKRFD